MESIQPSPGSQNMDLRLEEGTGSNAARASDKKGRESWRRYSKETVLTRPHWDSPRVGRDYTNGAQL